MKAPPSQPFLLELPCGRCPVAAHCDDRGDWARACLPIDFQVVEEHALSHRSEHLVEILRELDDFRLPESIPSVPELALPPYLAQIDPSTKLEYSDRFVERLPTVSALTLSKFISKGGSSYEGGVRNVQRLRSRGAKSVVLVGTATDRRLEGVWKAPERFIEALHSAQIELVLGPAFSIYQPPRMPLERLANRARNLAMYSMLRDAGIASIPAVGFIDPLDAERAGAWVNRLAPAAVIVDMQSADREWELARQSMVAFLNRAQSLTHVVVNGVANPRRVVELARLVRPVKLTLTNGNAFQLARSRHDYYPDEDGTYRRWASAARESHLFANLVRFYSQAAGEDEPMPYAPLSLQRRLRGI